MTCILNIFFSKKFTEGTKDKLGSTFRARINQLGNILIENFEILPADYLIEDHLKSRRDSTSFAEINKHSSWYSLDNESKTLKKNFPKILANDYFITQQFII